jgi:hypothetical protein
LSAALAAKFELEQSTEESQSLFNVTDLKRYIVETDRASFPCFSHGVLQRAGAPPTKSHIVANASSRGSTSSAARNLTKKEHFKAIEATSPPAEVHGRDAYGAS